MVKAKDKNLDRFVWKEGDIQIIEPKTGKKATVKKSVKKMIEKKKEK
ncbi:hypothetical protein M0R19_05215 [Candidatus Pacearchaeota archaeon]|jgi:hypothetical protein|nr:hypothetical protein [Candidatus Pacearchaeota archaeon]